MPRTCNCAGPCGPGDDNDKEVEGNVSRRGFLTLLGTSALAAPVAAVPFSWDEWKRELQGAAVSGVRRLHSDTHTDARFPLGGIGTGSFEIGSDGRMTTWQLWNTLRDGQVPFFFGVQVKGAPSATRILQTKGGPPGLPTVTGAEMTGRYPVVSLRFQEEALPVHVSLTAFTPFAPLDSAFSSYPTAVFVFRVENPTAKPQTVSLGAFLQNVIGYDAFGPVQSFNSVGFNDVGERWSDSHPNFGGNRTETLSGETFTGLHFTAHSGGTAQCARPLQIYTNRSVGELNAHPFDHAPGFRVLPLGALPSALPPESDPNTLLWLENAGWDIGVEMLERIRRAVTNGATLLWSGSDSPLLNLPSPENAAPRPDVVFEDFEHGYGKWTVEGDAFGTAPVGGTLEHQQPVSGFSGSGMVNSYVHGDDATGKLTSLPFGIDRRYIRFLVGGGSHPTTQIRLLIDGKIVRRQSGKNEERLLPAHWDVSEFAGKTAHLEIVDQQNGPWGHINIDQIEFGDLPVAGDLIPLLRILLPDTKDGVSILGKGRIARHETALLASGEAELVGARQKAFATLADLAGVPYTVPVGVSDRAPGWGTMALGVFGGDTRSVHPSFEGWTDTWKEFAAQGSLSRIPGLGTESAAGSTNNGAVTAKVTLSAGETKEVGFALTWRFPNHYAENSAQIGNHYAERWPDAATVLRDVVKNQTVLRQRTEQFVRVMHESTLPAYVLDALTSQISTIRHPGVVIQPAKGDVYGWEGSNGCCAPTCTHVWGYEQTLAYVFPDLEREMRRIDFLHQQNPDGGINNRTQVPSPPHPTGEHPFADGHASSILKFYREFLLQPDEAYLTRQWPRVRSAVEYLIRRDAASSPDGKPDGTIRDDQWNTYDNAIHGVNTFIGTYYLAALRAGEEMARRVGDTDSVKRFHSVFEAGSANLVKLCWNGDYFEQHLPDYAQRSGEYGPGCLSDQLLGQWWAHQLGLGYLLPQDKVKSAMKAIVRNNWRTDFTNFRHNWRKFAGGNDKGLLICTWPKGGRPANPIPYVDEVWTGVEYQVAAHLVYEGMSEEALSIVKGVRDRYDGRTRAPMPRNPWNEIECGGHYARAMSSWSLLLALSGFAYDNPKGILRFTPRNRPEDFQCLFSAAEGWGSLRQLRKGDVQTSAIQVVEGKVKIAEVHLRMAGGKFPKRVQAQLNGRPLPASVLPGPAEANCRIALDSPRSISSGSTVTIIASHLS